MSPQQQKHKIEMEIIDKSKSSNSEKDKSNMASSNTLQNPTLQNEIISAANPIAPPVLAAPPVPPQSDKKECQICFDRYNKYTRIQVTCPSCGFNACRK